VIGDQTISPFRNQLSLVRLFRSNENESINLTQKKNKRQEKVFSVPGLDLQLIVT
jgi:hypothetical protein